MIHIHFSFNKESLSKINNKIKFAFLKIKEEFDDHLNTINENTNEIQANHAYIKHVEAKLDKLAESVEQIALILRHEKNTIIYEDTSCFDVSPLTIKEKEVFQAVYTLESEKGKVTYKDIATRLCIPEGLVMSYITNLTEKGIPIIKNYIDRQAYIKIHPNFRNIQAKENILGIDVKISQSVVSDNLA